jgi:hypothetical protein
MTAFDTLTQNLPIQSYDEAVRHGASLYALAFPCNGSWDQMLVVACMHGWDFEKLQADAWTNYEQTIRPALIDPSEWTAEERYYMEGGSA